MGKSSFFYRFAVSLQNQDFKFKCLKCPLSLGKQLVVRHRLEIRIDHRLESVTAVDVIIPHTKLILGFVQKGPTPPMFPKGGQPANQMGNGVFLMLTSPSPLKKN